ncbi:MAG TPA: hypothetical protein VK629_09295 [Steroidobacteraceae bacterium]|nr:hypothetical protein [Steroidobacteraceae bacterium]
MRARRRHRHGASHRTPLLLLLVLLLLIIIMLFMLRGGETMVAMVRVPTMSTEAMYTMTLPLLSTAD